MAAVVAVAGAGLAGGDWSIIAAIINEELSEEDHTLVEFVAKRRGRDPQHFTTTEEQQPVRKKLKRGK